MALEDNFLRLDPYNFDTEKDFLEYTQEKERNDYDERIDNKNNGNNTVSI